MPKLCIFVNFSNKMRLEQVHRTYLQNETVSKLMTKKKLLPGGALKKFHKIHTKCQKKKEKKKMDENS